MPSGYAKRERWIQALPPETVPQVPPSTPHSQSGGDPQDDVLGEPHSGPQQIKLQKTHYEESTGRFSPTLPRVFTESEMQPTHHKKRSSVIGKAYEGNVFKFVE